MNLLKQLENTDSPQEKFKILTSWWNGLNLEWQSAFVEKTILKSLLNELVWLYYPHTVTNYFIEEGCEIDFTMGDLKKHIPYLFDYMGKHLENDMLKYVDKFFTTPLFIKICGFEYTLEGDPYNDPEPETITHKILKEIKLQ